MTNGVEDQVRRADLAYATTHQLDASGGFQFEDATYSVWFKSKDGLLECLDLMMSREHKPATPRFHLRAQGRKPSGPEAPPSNLRFDFDQERGIAAAVVLAVDRHDEMYAWMTRGDAGRDDVFLTHDSWNPDEKRFPPRSFITIDQLRLVLVQWAFGDVLPPPAVEWSVESPDDIGWF